LTSASGRLASYSYVNNGVRRTHTDELLTKGEILEQKIAAGTEGRDKHAYRYR
jgi:hypothetical protein